MAVYRDPDVRLKRLSASQYDLSDKTGISRSYISQIESGLFNVSLEYLVSVANVLDVGIEELLKDSLEAFSSKQASEVERILLGCSPEEERILTKNMKDIRETIRPYDIK